MSAKLLETNCFVTILGGGHVSGDTLDRILALAPILVAADGGADWALVRGTVPDLVIGDMDSLSESGRAALPEGRVHRIAEQDSTDFEKCLRSIQAPMILAVGVAGPRVDHLLAALNCLVRHSRQRCIIVGDEDVIFHCPSELTLDLPVGSRLSLFPMTRLSAESEGLEWPLDGLTLSPQGRIGTSNRVTAPRLRIRPSGPGLLVLLPRAHLDRAISALRPAG